MGVGAARPQFDGFSVFSIHDSVRDLSTPTSGLTASDLWDDVGIVPYESEFVELTLDAKSLLLGEGGRAKRGRMRESFSV